MASWEEHRAALARVEQLKDVDAVEGDLEIEALANFIEDWERKHGEA
jgi:hypothetical protein